MSVFDGTIYWHRYLTAFQGEIRTLKSTVSDLSGRLEGVLLPLLRVVVEMRYKIESLYLASQQIYIRYIYVTDDRSCR